MWGDRGREGGGREGEKEGERCNTIVFFSNLSSSQLTLKLVFATSAGSRASFAAKTRNDTIKIDDIILYTCTYSADGFLG